MAIRGDLHERRVFTICRREGEWRVMVGETTLVSCNDHALASAAAARLAREAISSGTMVRIVEG